MYGKYFVGKRKLAVITLTEWRGEGRGERDPRPFPRTNEEGGGRSA